MEEIPFKSSGIYRIKWQKNGSKEWIIADYQLIETKLHTYMLKRHDSSRLLWEIQLEYPTNINKILEFLKKNLNVSSIEFIAENWKDYFLHMKEPFYYDSFSETPTKGFV